MVTYLDMLPVDWNVIKKTKIGKAVNSALKAKLFDEVTMEKTSLLVNKWKVMVSELKSQQVVTETSNSSPQVIYNNQGDRQSD